MTAAARRPPHAGDLTAPGVATRRAAMGLLDAVLRKGLPLEAALGPATRALPRADDRALAHALAAEALRRLPDLDALIDGATQRALPDDAKARFALRVALVQALVLGTPPHAAIATVLPLVDGGPRRLVHGVFGTILRRGTPLPDPPHLPAAVAARWAAAWGADVVAAARARLAAPPPLDLTLRDAGETALWAARLGDAGQAAESLAPGHLRLRGAAAVGGLAGYGEGAWWVQDLAASLPARLFGPGGGRSAIDLCAAPGGKTLQLAAAGWAVTALDLSDARLARLRENLARTALAARVVEADAGLWTPAVPADAVLLDAPCSATGIFGRHPDVLHRVRPAAIADLAAGQRRLLAHAARMVAPGGRLVYAVCSLEREEGEDIVAGFDNRDFAPDPIRADELPAGIAPTADGVVRVLPGMLAQAGGADGFFVARWRRRS